MTDLPASERPVKRGRGRPRRDPLTSETRAKLIYAGMAHLTERGYATSGVDDILAAAGVPKGSFYHHFSSKADFGKALIAAYHDYFVRTFLLDLEAPGLAPLDRIRTLSARAEAGMARHNFRRGCLVGNLGQEMGALPEDFRTLIVATLADWQARLARCLTAARDAGELADGCDCDRLAGVFWSGWEGAVLRAKLELSPQPLRDFSETFLTMISKEGSTTA